MNPLQLPLIAQAFYCEPLALELGHFHNLSAYLLPRLSGKASAADLTDLSAALADKPHKFGHQRSNFASPRRMQDGSIDQRYYNTIEGRSDIAVIPFSGVMAKNAGFLQEACMGMVSHDRIAHALNQALTATEITTIILDVNSPGGQIVGTPELAALIQAAGAVKPTYAFVDYLMASAAVYAGIQAAETYITPSARIGSIGTIMGVLDDSVRMQMEGLKLEIFAAGKHKALGSPGRSLTQDDKDYLMSIVTTANDGFLAAVQQARPNVAEEVLTGAKVYTGKQAVTLGLVDGVVSSWEEFISLL